MFEIFILLILGFIIGLISSFFYDLYNKDKIYNEWKESIKLLDKSIQNNIECIHNWKILLENLEITINELKKMIELINSLAELNKRVDKNKNKENIK